MSLDEKKELLDKIASELEFKNQHMLKAYSSTKDLEIHMQNDDRISSREAIAQRAGQLEEANACDLRIQKLLKAHKKISVSRFVILLKGGIEESGFSHDDDFKNVIALVTKGKLIWQRTVEIDQRLSKRVIGKSSFYA